MHRKRFKFCIIDCAVPQIPDEDCKQVAFPFLCQYMFPLCDVPADGCCGNMLLPSQEECIKVSEHQCRNEWILAKTYGYGALLPNCDDLPLKTNGIIIIHHD